MAAFLCIFTGNENPNKSLFSLSYGAVVAIQFMLANIYIIYKAVNPPIRAAMLASRDLFHCNHLQKLQSIIHLPIRVGGFYRTMDFFLSRKLFPNFFCKDYMDFDFFSISFHQLMRINNTPNGKKRTQKVICGDYDKQSEKKSDWIISFSSSSTH
jgi:hypothetical protein